MNFPQNTSLERGALSVLLSLAMMLLSAILLFDIGLSPTKLVMLDCGVGAGGGGHCGTSFKVEDMVREFAEFLVLPLSLCRLKIWAFKAFIFF